jgi:hypothetical protein
MHMHHARSNDRKKAEEPPVTDPPPRQSDAAPMHIASQPASGTSTDATSLGLVPLNEVSKRETD